MSLPNFALAGSFGCTIKPALKNINASGTEIDFPNDVTKIFFNTREANAWQQKRTIMEKLQFIKNLLRDDAYEASEYNRKYISNELSSKLKEKCGKIPPGPLHLLRFPYLGVDFFEIQKPNITALLLQLPVATVLKEMLKLMTHVQIIRENGYIHGDIRMENVVIHPLTGRMTLIDFDFFEKTDVYLKKHYLWIARRQNNMPPEILLSLFENETEYKQNVQAYYDYYTHFYTSKAPLFFSRKAYGSELFQFQEILKANKEYLTENDPFFKYSNIHAKLQPYLLQYMDSFGLGVSLMFFLSFIYGTIIKPGELKEENYADLARRFQKGGVTYNPAEIEVIARVLHDVGDQIMFPLMRFSMERRMDLTEAIPRMKQKIDEFEHIWQAMHLPLPNSPISNTLSNLNRTTEGFGKVVIQENSGNEENNLPKPAAKRAKSNLSEGGSRKRQRRQRPRHRKTQKRRKN